MVLTYWSQWSSIIGASGVVDPLGRKDKYPIPFSSTLDLSSYRTASNKTSSKYELSAVVSHLGGTNGGHYRCIAKGEDSCWNIFDDLRKIGAKESQALEFQCTRKSYTYSMVSRMPSMVFFSADLISAHKRTCLLVGLI